MKTYCGVLIDWFETGLEGVVWALKEDGVEGYEGIHVIEAGDELTVFSRGRVVLWQGIIRCDRMIGRIKRPTNPAISQQTALGC